MKDGFYWARHKKYDYGVVLLIEHGSIADPYVDSERHGEPKLTDYDIIQRCTLGLVGAIKMWAVSKLSAIKH